MEIMVQIKHLIATTLVGWYLMCPASHQQASLMQWKYLSSFDSSNECIDAIYHLVNYPEYCNEHTYPDERPVCKTLQFGDAECIASDDPRLKELIDPRLFP